jgi:hypothetical protein
MDNTTFEFILIRNLDSSDLKGIDNELLSDYSFTTLEMNLLF